MDKHGIFSDLLALILEDKIFMIIKKTAKNIQWTKVDPVFWDTIKFSLVIICKDILLLCKFLYSSVWEWIPITAQVGRQVRLVILHFLCGIFSHIYATRLPVKHKIVLTSSLKLILILDHLVRYLKVNQAKIFHCLLIRCKYTNSCGTLHLLYN